jgi:hypothetical protein
LSWQQQPLAREPERVGAAASWLRADGRVMCQMKCSVLDAIAYPVILPGHKVGQV